MKKVATAEIDPHMRRAWAVGFKENEIARLLISELDDLTDVELDVGCSRKTDAVLGIDVLNKTAAVESAGIFSAPDVGNAHKGATGHDHVVNRFAFAR